MDILSKLQAPEGAVKKNTRVGRGVGSGLGKTAGRGQKGQKARSTGNFNKKHFQGGQTPIQRRLPKRGFRNPLATPVHEVNVGDLERFDKGATVDLLALHATRLIHGHIEDFRKGKAIVKVLGHGDLTKGISVTAHKFSKSAQEKIEKAGGSVTLLPQITPRAPKADAKAAPKAAKAKKADGAKEAK